MFCDMGKLHGIQFSVAANKVLSEHSHARWITRCLGLLLHHKTELSISTQTGGPARPKLAPIWPCTGEVCQPMPWVAICLLRFPEDSTGHSFTETKPAIGCPK